MGISIDCSRAIWWTLRAVRTKQFVGSMFTLKALVMCSTWVTELGRSSPFCRKSTTHAMTSALHALRRRCDVLGSFCVGDVGAMSEAPSDKLDIVPAMSLLHQLDHEQALQFFRTSHEVNACGGIMITIEPAFAVGQHVFAK